MIWRQNSALFLFFILPQVHCMKYPNEVEGVPMVVCEADKISVKIKTTTSNPSLVYVEEYGEDTNCVSNDKNIIDIKHGTCGMSTERTTDPMGAVQRVCINVQLHPMFVTEADRSYCVQCVYVEQHVISNFEHSLTISEEIATEIAPQFDFNTVPKCEYSIRKGSPTGPPAHYAVIGDSVFHVWKCDGNSQGILVQNCYVEDGQGSRILIIDQNGCGVDRYVMETPQYSADLNTAFQETHVFKFARKTVTRFACQIRVCVRGEMCTTMAPQNCPALTAAVVGGTVAAQPEYDGSFKAFAAPTKTDSILPFNETFGSVMARDKMRRRRATMPQVTPRMTKEGYPEMEVVGELRVLDSHDDVRYYEHAMTADDGFDGDTTGVHVECVSGPIYTAILSGLVLLSSLLILLVLFMILRNNHYKKSLVLFPH